MTSILLAIDLLDPTQFFSVPSLMRDLFTTPQYPWDLGIRNEVTWPYQTVSLRYPDIFSPPSPDIFSPQRLVYGFPIDIWPEIGYPGPPVTDGSSGKLQPDWGKLQRDWIGPILLYALKPPSWEFDSLY